MITLKDINKIKDLYYNQNIKIIQISRIFKLDKTQISKYVKIKKIITYFPRKKYNYKKYLDIIEEWIIADKKNPKTQRLKNIDLINKLKEKFPNDNLKLNAISKKIKEIRKNLRNKKMFLPLIHKPGECQIDFGICHYLSSGKLKQGYTMVMTFPYSCVHFVQFYKNKNIEMIFDGLKNFYKFIGGIPVKHTFDNDPVIINYIHKKGVLTKEFNNFLNYYHTILHLCNNFSPHEKIHVEIGIKYTRKNYFVPIPEIEDFELFNKQLLNKCCLEFQKINKTNQIKKLDLFTIDLIYLLPLNDLSYPSTTEYTDKTDILGQLKFFKQIIFLGKNFISKEIIIIKNYKEIIIIDLYNRNNSIILERSSLEYNNISWKELLEILRKNIKFLQYSYLFKILPKHIKLSLFYSNLKLKKLFISYIIDNLENNNIDDSLKKAYDYFDSCISNFIK